MLNWSWNCTCFVIMCIKIVEAIEKIINEMGRVWIPREHNKERTKFEHVYVGLQDYFYKVLSLPASCSAKSLLTLPTGIESRQSASHSGWSAR